MHAAAVSSSRFKSSCPSAATIKRIASAPATDASQICRSSIMKSFLNSGTDVTARIFGRKLKCP